MGRGDAEQPEQPRLQPVEAFNPLADLIEQEWFLTRSELIAACHDKLAAFLDDEADASTDAVEQACVALTMNTLPIHDRDLELLFHDRLPGVLQCELPRWARHRLQWREPDLTLSPGHLLFYLLADEVLQALYEHAWQDGYFIDGDWARWLL